MAGDIVSTYLSVSDMSTAFQCFLVTEEHLHILFEIMQAILKHGFLFNVAEILY